MSNATLFIAGTTHQGHERFSDVSRGRQCSFMSFSALLCAQSRPVSQWSTYTVDQILTEGDRMYLNAFERQTIPNTETLSLTYLPDRARWCSPYTVIQSSCTSFITVISTIDCYPVKFYIICYCYKSQIVYCNQNIIL